MKPDLIVVRLGELTLKGRNRSRFEKTVHRHIRRKLTGFPQAKLESEYGRVYIWLNGSPYEPIAEGLTGVFGIGSYSPVFACEPDLAVIESLAVELVRSREHMPETFKVSARRADKSFPHDSMALNRHIGGCILREFTGIKVDVHNPELELRVELREGRALLYEQVSAGAGGFPLGTNGKAMLMLSGGIDSPVAGWLAMRQGLEIEAVHFHSYPYTSERSQQKVKDLAGKLAEYGGTIRLHMVPFTDIQVKLVQSYNDNLLITVMRRIMFRIAEKLALKNGAQAIVTGESLGQVASQTMSSLYAIGSSVRIPVLQPLIFQEKQEIIRTAEKIGTFAISILPHEDCCTVFLPPSPSTNPNLNVVEAIERQLTWLPELIEQTVNQTELHTIQVNRASPFEKYY
jgi:thiamine biosynthesis protein ThiI